MTADPTLEDALDGLQDAERYCEEAGLEDLGKEIADLYQRVGAESDDWSEETD